MSNLKYPEIIKVYDVRGVWNQNLFSEDIVKICSAIAQSVENKEVFLGRDSRSSSPEIHRLLIDTLLAEGKDVIDLGMITTPMLYFATYKSLNALGFMITGSHNPPPHNGLKLTVGKRCLRGEEIARIIRAYKGDILPSGGIERLESRDIYNVYIEKLLSCCYLGLPSEPAEKIHIIWDPGNGVTAILLKKLIRFIPGKHFIINENVNGDFFGRSPNPTASNLSELVYFVKKQKCNLGFAFDGDGDRVVLVLPESGVLSGDQLLFILAMDLLERVPGAKIVVDVKIGEFIIRKIEKMGGKVVVSPTGHSIIKEIMQKEKALLGGEKSGHIFCAENYYGFDDAMCAALKCLVIGHNKISRFYSQLPEVFIYERNIGFKKELSIEFLEILKNLVKSKRLPISTLDGVRYVKNLDFWLVRSSNTEDILNIILEASSYEALYCHWEMLYELLLEAVEKTKFPEAYSEISMIKFHMKDVEKTKKD